MSSIKELQAQLKAVTEERDALQKDIEGLCLASSNSFFSGSYVLSEQLLSLQKELREAKAQLKAAKEAQELEQQNTLNAKAAQNALESALGDVRQQLLSMTTEKEFHRASAARCLTDVEAKAEEVAAVRQQLAEAELMLSKAEGQATIESRARKEAETALAERQQQLARVRSELESKKGEASSFSRQLVTARETLRKQQTLAADTQAKLDAVSEELKKNRQQLQSLREEDNMLRLQLQEANAMVAQLQGTSSGQAEQITSLTSQLQSLQTSSDAKISGLQASETETKQKLTAAQDQVTELSQELRQTRQDLAELEKRLNEARQAEHQHRTAHAKVVAQLAAHEKVSGSPAVTDTLSAAGSPTAPSLLSGGADSVTDTAAALLEGGADATDAADAAEQLTILRTMVHDLKLKLAQATQEKVEALMAMAEIKQKYAARSVPGQQPPTNHVPHEHVDGAASGHAAGGTYTGIATSMMSRFGGLGSSFRGFGAGAGGWLGTTPGPGGVNAPVSKSAGKAGLLSAKDLASSPIAAGSTDAAGNHATGTSTPTTPAASQQAQISPSGGSTSPLSAPGSRAVSVTGPQSNALETAALTVALQQLHQDAQAYLAVLRVAARSILNTASDLPSKWAALNKLSQIHEKVNHTRARMGLDKPASFLLDQVTPPSKLAANKGTSSGLSLDMQLASQVLELVDLVMSCLEAFHRQEAMSSVMMSS